MAELEAFADRAFGSGGFRALVTLEEATCMHRGAPECLIQARAVAARVA